MNIRDLKGQKVDVTLVKSVIASKPNQKKTVRALGLRKMGATRTHTVNDVFLGMYSVVEHMVSVKPSK